jgi:26S proteasome regulatory subunit N7
MWLLLLQSLLGVIDIIRGDMYTHPHVRYYMREVRLVAYNQFLESYKSVTLDSMATAFDVGLPFLDTEVRPAEHSLLCVF